MKTVHKKTPRLSRQFLRDQQWVSEHMYELVEKYPNQWIAVYQGQVMGQGEEAFKIWKNADKLNLGQPYLWFVEREVHVY